MRFTRRLFLSLLGLTGLVAIGAYWWQFEGLAGEHGVAPLADNLEAMRRGDVSFFEFPTLLWLSSKSWFVQLLLFTGCASSALLLVGRAPRWAALALWGSWVSVVQVGYPFLSFQWDILLVETAFCAVFYAPGGWRPFTALEREPHPGWRLMMGVLACKVTLESGLVKVLGGDPSWRDLTALTYHWWSQPLPTWTSVALSRAPLLVHQALCAAMFVLELLFPLLIFGPRPVRQVGALGLMALQAGLMAAGNYSFYNLLTFVLAVPLLDDALLARWFRTVPVGRPGTLARGLTPWLVAAVYLVLSVEMFAGRGRNQAWLREHLAAFDTINAYGAFARMTKERAEIILEGSADGVTWAAYEFPWKPGDVSRRPTFVAPWQPRLDWQMWFASLGDCGSNPWVLTLQQRLLERRPEVLALFEAVPPTPPTYLRTRSFEYRFAPPGSPDWWVRTETGPYCPPVRLDADGRLTRARF